jgi:hypothetical protein
MDPVTIECSTGKELLSEVTIRGERFRDVPRGAWVFRGQADASWGLAPGAFRDGTRLVHGVYTRDDKPWSDWSNADQIQAEAQTLREFASEADGNGFPIPLDSPELRDQLLAPMKAWYTAKFEAGEIAWPPRLALPLIALAQHYGLGTRCLDWTRSPSVALYFAVSGILDPLCKADSFGVWAFSLAIDSVWKGLEGPIGGLPERTAIVVDAPYASNPNLRAQEGAFITVPVTKLPFREPAERLDFIDHLRQVRTYRESVVPLYKFVAPRVIAAELLWELARDSVSASRLFPGYAGASRGVLEAKLHKTPWSVS